MPFDSGSEETNKSAASNAERLAFVREYAPAKRDVEAASGVLRAIVKRYRAMGVDTKANLNVHRLMKLELDEARAQVREFIRAAALRGIIGGEQMDLFIRDIDVRVPDSAITAMQLAEAEDQGYRDGKAGAAPDSNPYPVGTELSQTWDKWRTRGMDQAQAEAAHDHSTAASPDREQPAGRDIPGTNGHAPEVEEEKPTPVAAAAPKPRGRPRKVTQQALLPPPKATKRKGAGRRAAAH